MSGKQFYGKATAVALCISASGGVGLACVLWCLTMALGGPDLYPVALPVSVAAGCGALAVFCALCGLYVHLRRKRSSVRWMTVDVLAGLLCLPGFLLLAMWGIDVLQKAV